MNYIFSNLKDTYEEYYTSNNEILNFSKEKKNIQFNLNKENSLIY